MGDCNIHCESARHLSTCNDCIVAGSLFRRLFDDWTEDWCSASLSFDGRCNVQDKTVIMSNEAGNAPSILIVVHEEDSGRSS